jgi:hypothetical protein
LIVDVKSPKIQALRASSPFRWDEGPQQYKSTVDAPSLGRPEELTMLAISLLAALVELITTAFKIGGPVVK